MNVPVLCLLLAGLMPFLWTAVAKFGGKRYDNRDPRAWQSRLVGLPWRAHAAHLNSFEAFPFFAAAVLAALHAGVAPGTASALAVAFVALRLGYGAAYLANLHVVRSTLWFGALGCCVALLVMAL